MLSSEDLELLRRTARSAYASAAPPDGFALGWVEASDLRTGGCASGLRVLLEEAGAAAGDAPFWPTAAFARALAALRDGAAAPALPAGARVALGALQAAPTVVGDGAGGYAGREPYVRVPPAVTRLVLAVATDGAEPGLAVFRADDVVLAEAPTQDATRAFARVEVPVGTQPETTMTGPLAATLRDRLQSEVAFANACEAAGSARSALERTVAYASTREQFGVPIGSFQVLKHRCADMASRAMAVSSALDAAAELLDDPDAPRDAVAAATSAARVLATEALVRSAGDAVQTHGGIGFTWELGLHGFLKRGLVDDVAGGTARWHRERYLSALLREQT